MKYTYNGTWNPARSVYWKDETTHAGLYMYYPYTQSVGDVSAMPFNIKPDQSNVANYKASDLLIGCTKDVAPTDAAIMTGAKHVMSQAVIKIVAGKGCSDDFFDSSTKLRGDEMG